MTGPLLAGRAAVVTGAARGIGRAVAEAFAAQGADVAVADIDEVGARDAAARIAERSGVRTVGVAIDVADPASVQTAVGAAEEGIGICDVVVANAGILLIKPTLDISTAEFERVQQINLTGAFTTTNAFARRLRDAGRSGSVIVSSSLFGLRGGAGNAAYAASKFALIGLVESMAADLAPHGIRVNAVCAGQIRSDMIHALFDRRAAEHSTSVEEEQRRFLQRIPLGRLGTPAEVADAYTFLASDLSRYITGQHLVVDGGWSLT